jgi:chaperone required for assembly of F1-ATPase
VSGQLKKCFYKKATVIQVDNAYHVHLDDKALRTPHGTIVSSSNRTWCLELAGEWNAQKEYIDPSLMPLTRIANSALDQVCGNRASIVAKLAAFAETDLIYHEAEEPQALVERQQVAWQPLREWAVRDLEVELVVATGIVAVPQPKSAITALRRRVDCHNDIQLAALHLATKLCGSVVIGLALSCGRVTGDEAWSLSRVDESWQIENWGKDYEAKMHAKSAEMDVLACANTFRLLA